MTVRILVGDCRKRLGEIANDSVSLVITSPPYWGLRAYKGVEPTIWGGAEGCRHEWGAIGPAHHPGQVAQTNINGRGHAEGIAIAQGGGTGQFCRHCSAWRGTLGNEPTIELYTRNMVEVFREVRRVLHPTGALVLNLGDSYATTPTGNPFNSPKQVRNAGSLTAYKTNKLKASGLKPKDLCGIPWRVAFALQRDGWWLRSEIPWIKRNPMPGSQRDRPTTGHEHIFLLAKSKSYYWDGEAIKKAHAAKPWGKRKKQAKTDTSRNDSSAFHHSVDPGDERFYSPSGRTYRTTDPWFASLDDTIEQQRAYLAHLEQVKADGGLLLDEDGEPLALQVNTKGFKGSRFAVFPEKLVLPFVRAGSSQHGVCEKCKAPWERLIERTGHINKREPAHVPGNCPTKTDSTGWAPLTQATKNWRPTCACNAERVPATILDPFGGAATVGLVADQNGRDAIICELSPPYAEMGHDRIKADGGMFSDVRIE